MRLLVALLLPLVLFAGTSLAAPVETPSLAEQVRAGTLPPVERRLPAVPYLDRKAGPGQHGGALRMLMAKAKDTRQMVVYGYARLLCYTPELMLEPDLLDRVEVQDSRIFTLHLRPGHKWSNGHPFTTEDFRYWWEDVANNSELSPTGPPAVMLADGKPPVFEVLNETTVRYSWETPNADFLPALAGARPLYIYRPAHYLKHFHAAHAPRRTLARAVEKARRRSWAALHNKLDSQYKNDNPDLPTLQPWVPVTRAPSDRFVFVRNPYYHRMDRAGRQLPYIDRVVMNIAASGLIPAKTAAGASDLQARYLRFDNVTFLKRGEEAGGYKVSLWRTGKGAHAGRYP
ncbi:MAG: ABC transporter substrate-binding protein, partial [Alphaproteobacteria bacterium]|nr:ABC transporter substrate-binding protein [Alphaproteobacteria bacterium]